MKSLLIKIKTWGCGKCELYHWIDILDIFDAILEDCCSKKSNNNPWVLPVDLPENEKKKDLLLSVISFTSLLIEHSFSRHLYNSIEHLIALLSSTDMQIVLAILNLLFVFSKRSNFFSRISADKRQALLSRLCYLAENWGGKDYGFGLAECCQNLPLSNYPSSATTLNFEFYSKETDEKNGAKPTNSVVNIHIENIHQIEKPISQLMGEIVEKYDVPNEYHTRLFTHLRLTKNFADYKNRLYCVQARLNALSIIVYCQSVTLQESNSQLLYTGLIEELVDVLELKNPELIEIKSASLKALTSIIHLDRNSKLKIIIDTTGASSYHGFLPIMVRNCINSLISGDTEHFPLNFATALFSFLYHLASYESGCEALVQCGIMESLLKIIDWKGPELDHITFVTRAVRVIDLITNLDMNAFQNNNGLNIFVQRLEHEVEICRLEQPFEIMVPIDKLNKEKNLVLTDDIEDYDKTGEEMPMEIENEIVDQGKKEPIIIDKSLFSGEVQCYPQRAALLKSMLNFLKKAVQYSSLSEGIRHLMYGNFPRSIRHIISNAEYYGPSLFLLATDVVSVYVYHEPSLLSTLQDNGLTDVVLYALLVKDVPSTKEVIASIPNVFTALCLNRRGLEAFIELKPFDRLFKIFLLPEYLQAMRRRRSESIGDTATSLGNAMDELMRHQPSLKSETIKATVKLLEDICKLGSDAKYICSKTKSNDANVGMVLTETSERVIPTTSNISNDLSSSEEEEDFLDDDTTTTTPPSNVTSEIAPLPSTSEENTNTSKQVIRLEQRQQIPLHDYIFNAMRFVDAILTNNSTDDHCREFLNNNGLKPLFDILKLPNLPPDFPTSPACYNVAGVFKSLLNLTHEKNIFIQCLGQLKEIIENLNSLFHSVKSFEGSVLLEDLIECLGSRKSFQSQYFITPILQAMSAVHAYIIMFAHICRTGQGDIRAISIELWGSELGIDIMTQLSRVYISLVWESTLLLGLNDATSQKYEFVKVQLEKLSSLLKNSTENENVASPMEVDTDLDPVCSNCGNRAETEKKSKAGPVSFNKNTQQKYIKPLLTVASKLGRSLAELFGLLVKLCVGRNWHILVALCASLTFYVCSIGFSSPMLFDDRKFPYHLMIQNFVLNGGQDAFFNCFKMAVGQNDFLETNELPDGIIEFLDSWLLLLQKMANPQTLLDSPHSLPSKPDKDYVPFDPIQYLIRTHKKTFACVLELWNDKLFKLNSESICNSLLTILSHLLKGESIIEKYYKDKENEMQVNVTSSKANTSSNLQNISEPLASSTSIVITRPSNSFPLGEFDPQAPNLDILVDMGFSRETAGDALARNSYDVEQAAEFLLQLSMPRPVRTSSELDMSEEDQVVQAIAMSLTKDSTDDQVKSILDKSKSITDKSVSHQPVPLKNEIPLGKSELDSFTNNILSGTLKLLDQLPDTVYKCCELLIAVSKRNGKTWFQDMISELIKEITNNIRSLVQSTSFVEEKDENSGHEWANQLATLPEAHKLSFRIHLLALLFNEMKCGCAQQISNSDLFQNMVELLERSSYLLTLLYEKESKIVTPKWLCPLILLIDVYEKYALASQRRNLLLTKCSKRQWKFFDDRTSRWTSYIPVNNKAIDEAFRNGEQFYRFSAVRRRYTIQFNNMLQVNEETGNWRPIMFVSEESSNEKTDSTNLPPVSNTATNLVEWVHIESINEMMAKSLIDTMVSLVKLPIDPDTLHAVMRLCLRLTRDYSNACLFAELGGISTLLNLSKEAQFVGIVSMTSLIIRHVIEDANVLKVVMEKIIRFQTTNSNQEVNYMFRYFNPAACRDIDLFKESAKAILRINVFNQKLNDDTDRSTTLFRTLSLKAGENPDNSIVLPKITKDVVTELLNLLPLKRAEENKALAESTDNKSGDTKKAKGQIFTSSSILALLAELTRSYNPIAKIICEHIYPRGYTEVITDECNTLSFILDNLLYLSTTNSVNGDKDYPSFSKILFAALASVTYTGDVHQSIVVEIKSCLNRTTLYPESNEKHSKLQAISMLIYLVVESCPNSSNPRTCLNSTSIIKLMAKRGLITDLAKVIQSLDLSSPNMPITVNSLLRTLEYISKTLNCNWTPNNMMSGRVNRLRSELPTNTTNEHQSTSNDPEVMEVNVSNENANNTTNEDTGVPNVPASDTTSNNPIVGSSTLASQMDSSNAESDLFGVGFDFNSHPRSETFNSDDLRTDDDDDDIMQHNVNDNDLGNNHSELLDNTVNSNCAESESSDDSQTEDDEDDDDSEVDEEEDDGAGSTQDEHEEEDDEDQLDEDDEDVDEEYFQDILDENLRNYPDPSLFVNIEEVFPSFLIRPNDRYNQLTTFIQEETSLNNDNPAQVVISTPDVLVQHPLLSNNIEISANASQFYSINQSNSNASIINPRVHSRGVRARSFRSSMIGSSNPNWHLSSSRNTSVHILNRLLGSNGTYITTNDLVNGLSRHSNLLGTSHDIPEEDLYNSGNSNGFASTYSNGGNNQNSSLNAIPSVMCRWYEESRVLDGEYMYDAIFLIRGEIMKHLDKFREEELKGKEKKKHEDVKITSLIKELKSRREHDNPNAETEQSSDTFESSTVGDIIGRNDSLHAHIEELANSVINRVLEPHQAQEALRMLRNSEESLANILTIRSDNNETVDRSGNYPDSERIEMEVGNEEQVDISSVPMATDVISSEAVIESDITVSQATNESVPELMDQSTSEQIEQPTVDQVQSNENVTSAASTSNRITYELTPEERAILGDQEIPEGVDPSFLAALPENIRQEVIAEQFRLQRLNNIQQQEQQQEQQQQQQQSSQVLQSQQSQSGVAAVASASAATSFAEVNPEFLAALPPNIQEEVLAQQRAEQQRLASQNTNPDAPVDPDSFFRSLPPSLRRQVLADLDDSQLRLLPNEFANEARTLRQEYEVRHRQIQERLFNSSNTLSRIIRNATSGRGRYVGALQAFHPHQWSFNYSSNRLGGSAHSSSNRNSLAQGLRYHQFHRSVKGKQIMDYDSLSSLLILLFIQDNLLNSARLHRLIRNICMHAPTRQWVIQSLLEIMEKTKESIDRTSDGSNFIQDSHVTDEFPIKFVLQNPAVSWLSISLESAFGSKTNVFYLQKSNSTQSGTCKKQFQSTNNFVIFIHPQAATFVCRNVLDVLNFLVKSYADQFISNSVSNSSFSKNVSTSSPFSSSGTTTKPESQHETPTTSTTGKNLPNFFDVLMRHDSIHAMNKKTKVSKHSKFSNDKKLFLLIKFTLQVDLNSVSMLPQVDNNMVRPVDQSPYTQLLNLLSHQLIQKNSMLTDKLMRLLTQVTYFIVSDSESRNISSSTKESTQKVKYQDLQKSLANEKLLKLVVDVLISKSCSEEGLIDATSLLIKLSTLFPPCRTIFYKLLLDGVRILGENVYSDLNALAMELSNWLSNLKIDSNSDNNMAESVGKSSNKGILRDRYSSMNLVISVPNSSKPNVSGKEVQLPSMSALISKSSSQFLFLRILKIIMHLREICLSKAKSATAANSSNNETKMEVDKEEDKLSSELVLDQLWDKLSDCLRLLSDAPDDHAVLVLQPAVEAFFLVHAPEKSSSKFDPKLEPVTQQVAHINQSMAGESFSSELHNDSENRQYNNLPPDTQKFLLFAEKHRVVLNQILRQSNVHLINGPFAVLVDHTRILDFDVKRRYFRQELERLDHNVRRDDLALHIRRENVFEDSYRDLNRRTPEDWKNRFYVVFDNEEGQDAGGLLREWYTIISREIFNPNYALFTTSPGDRVTYMINSASHCNSNHLSYFKFVGRVIAKAIYDNKLLDCYFTRSFYKHILGKPVKYTDMESEDFAYYQGLVYLLENNLKDVGTDLTFSTEVQEFGVTETRDIIPNGRNILVNDENKHDYVRYVCQEKMTGAIRKQLNSFLEGFYEIIPKRYISIFNEHELELLISGLPTIDIDDLKNNAEYHKYQTHSLQIQWFWRALRTFDQADRAKFLQFVTGTSKVPLQGFSALEGMNGPQKFQIHLDDRSTDRLPSAHTCFNQLDLPPYETYDKLRIMLLKAIHECSEGFGFA
ncbi:hypothetical protein RDWZM_001333 [Blomia tropicalis]|uniref:HECT-type E3 ubiquitin transferase n=1 Tax=Blomia tropicalis TaxID=40697 RepID=A0A9Q0RNU9_BLOTA|nr:hypothetical protein RDWZM_001333 [Blomia tropicalis]